MSEERPSPENESIRRDPVIDSVCDANEKALLTGHQPVIEDSLNRVDSTIKQPLLIELIKLNMHVRKLRGESVATSEGRDRFGVSLDPLLEVTECVTECVTAYQPAPGSVEASSILEHPKRTPNGGSTRKFSRHFLYAA